VEASRSTGSHNREEKLGLLPIEDSRMVMEQGSMEPGRHEGKRQWQRG
jgi:hypothetical protein